MKIILCAVALVVFGSEAMAADASLATNSEEDFIRDLQSWEAAKTDGVNAVAGAIWTLRSGHFIFGMPRLTDDRHNFTPEGFDAEQAGISVVVREGFVVAHFDQMKSPLWVAQRWTKFDHARMLAEPSLDRPWREDLDLPLYTRGGTKYDGNDTHVDRGHMARHAKNRAWGADVSNWGVKMSNSTPQHRNINRLGGTWGDLEDKARDIVVSSSFDIEAVWVYSGAIYRDQSNPDAESPDEDFDEVVRLTMGGFGVPDATFKVIGWFDDSHNFQARAYVFEQPHESRIVSGEQRPKFSLPNPKLPAENYLVKIDELEARIGVDFFPMLKNNIEIIVESADNSDLWGAE